MRSPMLNVDQASFPGSRLLGTTLKFLDFSLNREGKEQVVFWDEGRSVPRLSLALEQPRLVLVQP